MEGRLCDTYRSSLYREALDGEGEGQLMQVEGEKRGGRASLSNVGAHGSWWRRRLQQDQQQLVSNTTLCIS